MKTTSIKTKVNLALLKSKALTLFKNNQLPYKLVYFIQGLKYDANPMLVTYLMTQSEHMLRVSGYYKKYPEIAKEYNAIIEKDVNDILNNVIQ